MDSNVDAPKSSRRKRPRGAPRGNQNARKHGLYSPGVAPADRHAPLRRALRAYGFKPVRNADGIDLTDLVVNPDVNLPLLYSLIQAMVKLAEDQGTAQPRLGRRHGLLPPPSHRRPPAHPEQRRRPQKQPPASLSKGVTGTQAAHRPQGVGAGLSAPAKPVRNADGMPCRPASGGVQRGLPSFWGGEPLWGMCPQLSKNLWGGAGSGELERLCRRVGGPNQRRNADPISHRNPSSPRCGCRACPAPAPKEDHHKVQSHFNGPISRRSPTPNAEGAGPALPCPKGGSPQGAVPLQRPNLPPGPNPQAKAAGRLVSLCRFRAISRPGPRPTFGPRPRRYDLSPFFDRFNTPQRGPRPLIRSVPGRYDSSPFVDLSVAPQSQAAPASSRHRPPGKTLSTIQSNSYPPYAHRHPVGRVQGVPQRTTITRCSPTSTAQPPPWSNARKVWVQGLPCLTGVWERRDNRGHRALTRRDLMLDVLIANGKIIDGTGSPWLSGAVGVEAGRIRMLRGDVSGVQAKRYIDARGKVVCPGFIDMHAHSGPGRPQQPTPRAEGPPGRDDRADRHRRQLVRALHVARRTSTRTCC